tara:strand:- start:370 stop:717 length:348 start_codon:yes stop_codon:yes gene_type:complete
MKRLLVFVFTVMLLGSCNKQKTIYSECTITNNPDNSLFSFGFGMEILYSSSYSVGTTLTSQEYSAEKGSNWTAGVAAFPSNINSMNEYEIKFYVNGNLQETRTATNFAQFNFIVP